MRDTSDTIVQFEFGEDGTSPVEVSSSVEEDAVDVEAIADRVLDSEFETDAGKEQFLTGDAEVTNLSEHADEWWRAQSDNTSAQSGGD